MVVLFSDLPEELLIEVFKWLDGESVKNAALVCSEYDFAVILRKMVKNKSFSAGID